MAKRHLFQILLSTLVVSAAPTIVLAGFTMKVEFDNKTDISVYVQQQSAKDSTEIDSGSSDRIEWNVDQCLENPTYTLTVWADENKTQQIGTSEYRYDGTECHLKSNGTNAADDAYELQDESDSDHERKLLLKPS